jgi:hypothetical protein
VNKDQHQARVDRAFARLNTLRDNGGSEADIERAKTKIDRLLNARDALHGHRPSNSGENRN